MRLEETVNGRTSLVLTAVFVFAALTPEVFATGKGIFVNSHSGSVTVHGTTGITNTANTTAELTNNSGTGDLSTPNTTHHPAKT